MHNPHYYLCKGCGRHWKPPTRFRQDSQVEFTMKVCPCREAFYCGDVCQLKDWKEHKQTCIMHKRRAALSPMEIAVNWLLQHHDASIVEIAVAALGADVKLVEALDSTAAVLYLGKRGPNEYDMANPDPDFVDGVGMVQPFLIEKVELRSIKEEAQKRGYPPEYGYLENPRNRLRRLYHGDHARLAVTIIFEPTGRVVTIEVPRVQLGLWEMIQEQEKVTTNPPRIHWHRHITNGEIRLAYKAHNQRVAKKAASRPDSSSAKASSAG